MAAALALAIGLAACGEREPIGTTIVASSPGTIGVGSQRLLLVVADEQQALLGGPDTPATVTFSFAGEAQGEVEAEWVWGIPDVRGFYTVTYDFDEPGEWQASIDTEDGPATATPFIVQPEVVVPEVGSEAPRSVTRTAADHPIEQITSDTNPDPRFYQMTVAEAVTSGTPSVIAFVTPAFCQTAACGPVLDVVKGVMADYPGVNFVHVEIYENIVDQDSPLIEVAAVAEWGLRTEPWVFVVGADGLVTARFEGALGPEELRRALDAAAA
jgi:hypothetical protein